MSETHLIDPTTAAFHLGFQAGSGLGEKQALEKMAKIGPWGAGGAGILAALGLPWAGKKIHKGLGRLYGGGGGGLDDDDPDNLGMESIEQLGGGNRAEMSRLRRIGEALAAQGAITQRRREMLTGSFGGGGGGGNPYR